MRVINTIGYIYEEIEYKGITYYQKWEDGEFLIDKDIDSYLKKSDKVDGVVFLPTDSMDRLNGDMGIEPKIEITEEFLDESQSKGFWLETFDISED